MSFLYILSFISLLIQIFFITISIAAGLYYIAELVEEYTVIAKKVIKTLIFCSISIYLIFIFTDELSWTIIICGSAAQLLHLAILSSFPFVKFLSVQFLGAIVLLVYNHYLAFVYFNAYPSYSLTEILAYFTLCLWLVPFGLFVSLTANDNVLPTSSDETSSLLGNHNDLVTNYFSSKKKLGLLSFFNYAKDSVLPTRNKKSY